MGKHGAGRLPGGCRCKPLDLRSVEGHGAISHFLWPPLAMALNQIGPFTPEGTGDLNNRLLN